MSISFEMKKRIIEEAKYIIKNQATISQTASFFNTSPSTIKKHINNEDKLKSIDFNLYNDVKEAQKVVCEKGVKKGGENSKRTTIMTEEEKENIAKKILEMGWTLAQAEENLNIPDSTLYENLINMKNTALATKLKMHFDENRKRGIK